VVHGHARAPAPRPDPCGDFVRQGAGQGVTGLDHNEHITHGCLHAARLEQSAPRFKPGKATRARVFSKAP